MLSPKIMTNFNSLTKQSSVGEDPDHRKSTLKKGHGADELTHVELVDRKL